MNYKQIIEMSRNKTPETNTPEWGIAKELNPIIERESKAYYGFGIRYPKVSMAESSVWGGNCESCNLVTPDLGLC